MLADQSRLPAYALAGVVVTTLQFPESSVNTVINV